MTPDSPESRIQRLEREMSALQQQARDLAHDVETLYPVQMAVVRIEETVKRVDGEITGLRDAIAEDRSAAKARGEAMADEMSAMRKEAADASKATRTQMIVVGGGIISTIITVAGTLLATGGAG